jgi:HMG box factor
MDPPTPSRITEIERPRYTGPMQSARMDTPRTVLPHQQAYGRAQYPYPQPLQTHRERDEDMDLMALSSPDLKRRRFNENQRSYVANSPVSYPAPQQLSRNGGPPMSAGSYRQQLPRPGMLVRPGIMAPPPQHSPINQQARSQYPTRSSTFDESLRLPPLQTQISSSNPTSQRPDARLETRERQARSVEAMVMTIPYVNKIKLLTSVSPPLPAPGPTSPGQEIRGAIIAVEGSDKSLLAEVGAFINEYLSSKDFSCAIKTWGTSALPPAADTEMTDVQGDSSTVSIPSDIEEKDPFVEFLSIISGWHQKSLEMTKYITTAPTSAAPPPTEEGASSPKPKVLPIALVPNGFSLTTSDIFALRIPINDSYAPVDHWQWMATLWRGIVGADLTIYVSSVGKEEMSKLPGVEIKADCATIVVRILEGGKMDEKTARRLGFEVVEFVRNVENGFGRT